MQQCRNPQCRIGYGTPLVLEANGQPTLFSTGADWLYAYHPDTGKELWKLSYGALGFSIVPRPVAGHGMLFLSTSFMRPHVLAVRIDAQEPEIAWKYKRGAPSTPSPILVGDELYFVNDSGGIVTCLNAQTGAENWRERIGGNHSASCQRKNLFSQQRRRNGRATGQQDIQSPRQEQA